MNNRIDQLFKNKLGEHSIMPAEEGWAKVQAGLSKKNKTVVYWRAAAVITLMGMLLSVWMWLNSGVNNNNKELAQMKETKTEQIKPAIIKEEKQEVQASKEEVTKSLATSERKIVNRKRTAIQTEIEPKLVEEKNEEETIAQIQTEIVIESNAIAYTENTTEDKPMVIEFALPTIEEKNINATLASAGEAEKTSGIRKFLESARDIKNGEADFGNSLRTMKDELLAFDFKKDKTKRN